jgi:hypothetical protein
MAHALLTIAVGASTNEGIQMWDQYASLAAHYYVSGRFAARAGYVPLCGNLFHHAIERRLKCGLIKAGAAPQRRQPRLRTRLWTAVRRPFGNRPVDDADRFLLAKYRHSLKKAWRDLKRCHPGHDLSVFDQLIRDLDRWEEIRYPRRGIAMSVQRLSPQAAPQPSNPSLRSLHTYVLNVEQVDLFMQRTWSVMSINPEFFRITIGATHVQVAASVYEDDNVHLLYA